MPSVRPVLMIFWAARNPSFFPDFNEEIGDFKALYDKRLKHRDLLLAYIRRSQESVDSF
jgi:hypothetical protein